MIEKLSGRAGFAAGAAVCAGAARLRLLPAVRARPGALPALPCAARLLLRGDGGLHSRRACTEPRRTAGIAYGVLARARSPRAAPQRLRARSGCSTCRADKVPQCGPDLFFMLENFPLGTTLQKLIQGTGECAKVDWTFLGMSIAEWSLAWLRRTWRSTRSGWEFAGRARRRWRRPPLRGRPRRRRSAPAQSGASSARSLPSVAKDTFASGSDARSMTATGVRAGLPASIRACAIRRAPRLRPCRSPRYRRQAPASTQRLSRSARADARGDETRRCAPRRAASAKPAARRSRRARR